MPIIDPDNDAYNENSCTSWEGQLQNTKIILFEYQKAILALSQTDGIQSYKLDTGQTSQSVNRADLPRLIETSSILMSQIKDLELMLGIRPSVIQVCPNW